MIGWIFGWIPELRGHLKKEQGVQMLALYRLLVLRMSQYSLQCVVTRKVNVYSMYSVCMYQHIIRSTTDAPLPRGGFLCASCGAQRVIPADLGDRTHGEAIPPCPLPLSRHLHLIESLHHWQSKRRKRDRFHFTLNYLLALG